MSYQRITGLRIIEGRQGGGKTYHAVVEILNYLALGSMVYTNVKLERDRVRVYLKRYYSVEMDDARLVDTWDEECLEFWKHAQAGTESMPTLIVIDEADIYFPAEFKPPDDLRVIIKQLRKNDVDVIMTTQVHARICKRVREQATWIVFYRDMRQFIAAKLNWLFGDQFREIVLDAVTDEPMRDKMHTKDKKIYQLYNTKQKLGAAGFVTVEPKEALKRKAGVSVPVVIAVCCVAVVGSAVSLSVLLKKLPSIFFKQRPVASAPARPAPPAPPAQVVHPAPPRPVSNLVTIVATIDYGDGSQKLMLSDGTWQMKGARR